MHKIKLLTLLQCLVSVLLMNIPRQGIQSFYIDSDTGSKRPMNAPEKEVLRHEDDYEIMMFVVPELVHNISWHDAMPKSLPAINLSSAATTYGWEPDLPTSTNESVRLKRSDNTNDGETLVGEGDASPMPVPSVSADVLRGLGIDPAVKPKLMASPGDSGVVSFADVDETPFDAYGKLFFTDRFGRKYECSGAYVSEFVVLTAAHCVYDVDHRSFNKNYQFYQKYRNGRGVRKGVKKTLLYKGWYNERDPSFAYDYAFLAMNDKSSGGYLELDTPDDHSDWTAAGYPVNFNRGQVLQKIHGYKGSISKTVVETVNNPMGQGCSGGAWFVESEGRHLAVGINSFSIEGRRGMFSPRFKTDATKKLFLEAKATAEGASSGAVEVTQDGTAGGGGGTDSDEAQTDPPPKKQGFWDWLLSKFRG